MHKTNLRPVTRPPRLAGWPVLLLAAAPAWTQGAALAAAENPAPAAARPDKPAAAKPAAAKPAAAKPAAKAPAGARPAAEAPAAEAPAVLLIESSRQGATVLIDGKAVGKTPIESAIRLKPGRHEFVLQAAPTDPSSGVRQVVEVKAGERRVLDLSPKASAKFIEPPQAPTQPAAPVAPALAAQDSAAPPPATATVTATTAREAPSEATPFYKKWWFWTGVGAGAVLVIGLAAGLGARSGGDSSMIVSSPTWPGGTIDGRSSALLRVNLSLGGKR